MKQSLNRNKVIASNGPSQRKRSKANLQLIQPKEQPNSHQERNNIDFLHFIEQSKSALQVKSEAQQVPMNQDYQQLDRNKLETRKKHECVNHQLRCKKDRKRAIQKLAKRHSSKRSLECERELKTQNDRTIKDSNCPIESYHCTKCLTEMLKLQEYILHCNEDCQAIFNQDSSPMPISNKQEAKMEPQIYMSISIAENKIALKDQSYPLSNEYDQINDNQSIKQIFALKLDHRNHKFFCGQCGYNSENSNGYFRHIATSHSSKVHPASSHIILRCYQSRSCLLYISLTTPWIHSLRKYSCPCNYHQRFNMKELSQHLMTVHSGVSPLYYLSLSPFIKRQSILSKQLELLQHIRDIIFSSQDLKQGQFSCGKCGKIYQMAGGYKNHMEKIHEGVIGRQSSHIILQTEYRFDIYLSPKIKWHHEDAIYFCPCSGLYSLMNMKELIEHVIEQHRGISPLYQTNKLSRWRTTQRNQPINRIFKQQGSISKWQDPMYVLLLQGYQDHRDLPFKCPPCEFESSHPKKYSNHMTNIHNSVIPPDASHIIFQFAEDFRHKKRKLYVCPSIEWKVNEHQNYYCPCMPRETMRMNRLIEHIVQIHGGVSPKYYLQKYDTNGTKYAKVETIKKQQIEKTTGGQVKWKYQEQGTTIQSLEYCGFIKDGK